jgi:hypothetical protein
MEAIGGAQVRLGSSHVVRRFFALSLNYPQLGSYSPSNIPSDCQWQDSIALGGSIKLFRIAGLRCIRCQNSMYSTGGSQGTILGSRFSGLFALQNATSAVVNSD